MKLPLATLAAAIAFSQPAPVKLETLIQKHIDALGGLAPLRAVQTVRVTGKLVLGGGTTEMPLQSAWKRPNLAWTSLTLQGPKIIEGFDGTYKWTMNPFTGPVPMRSSPEESAQAAEEPGIFEDALVDFKEKGNSVELAGREEGAYKLKVTAKTGGIQMIYLDITTFLIAKVEKNGKTVITPSNFKPVEGVKVPYNIEVRINGRAAMELQAEKIEINVPLEDALFQMPELGRKL
jgi:hypothetical protein